MLMNITLFLKIDFDASELISGAAWCVGVVGQNAFILVVGIYLGRSWPLIIRN